MVCRRVVSFVGFVNLGFNTISATHLCAEFAADISRKRYYPTPLLFPLQSYICSNFDDDALCSPHFVLLLLPSPLHTLSDASAVHAMQSFIVRSPFSIREAAQRARPQDRLVDVEVQLC